MIQKAWESDSLDNSKNVLLRVLEDVASRRNSGEDCPDESVISAHPQLMPELGEMLSAMSRAETARRIAAQPDSEIPSARSSASQSNQHGPGYE